MGKDLDSSTPILTPKGFIQIGSLKIGDTVYSYDGTPTKVTSVYAPPPRQLVEFEFSDGEKIISSIEHEWVTWEHADRKAFLRSRYEDDKKMPKNWPNWRPKRLVGGMNLERGIVDEAIRLSSIGLSNRKIGRALGVSRQAIAKHVKAGCFLKRNAKSYDDIGPTKKTTQEIIDTFTYSNRGDLNHCVPTAFPVIFDEAEQPIDPYILGVWLGDGVSAGGSISQSEYDQKFLRTEFERCGYKTTDRKAPNMFGTIGLHSKLKAMWLLNAKRIPENYVFSSIDQRIELIRGLMDTDGCVSGNLVEFCNTNKKIIDDLVFIIRSLGCKPTVMEKKPRKKEHATAWRVLWRPVLFNPFRIPRKALKVRFDKKQQFKHQHRMIKSWRYVEYRPTTCISVDHSSHLFLAGHGLIPTHNTRSGSEWVRHMIFEEGVREMACIGPSAREVRKVMVEGGILAASAPWEKPTYNKSSTIQTITWPHGAICHLLTAENPDRIRGYNLEAVWMDELAAWPENQFDEAMYNVRMATRKGAKPRFCVTTTPKPHKPFIKFFEDVRDWEKEGSAVITTGATFANAANLNSTFIKEIKQQYFNEEGEPTTIGRQEIFGEVLMDLDRRMWSEELLSSCQHRGETPTNMRKVVVSVDPSGSQRGDEVGIVVFGIDKDKKGWLMDDVSGKYSPKEWAEVAVKAYYRYQADYIVGEVNFGGDMVKQNVQNYDEKVSFRSVHATRGKQIRAIPVAAVYERGGIKHVVGNARSKYRDLEKQMCDMTFQGYIGDGSPDRLDALVWAVHETMLKRSTITGVTTLY